jgi:hypothetical protein
MSSFGVLGGNPPPNAGIVGAIIKTLAHERAADKPLEAEILENAAKGLIGHDCKWVLSWYRKHSVTPFFLNL